MKRVVVFILLLVMSIGIIAGSFIAVKKSNEFFKKSSIAHTL
ncbi:hypothetical protein [Marinisporobacter balticus]|uniref:Uncharacterized protein n=1 Tax=Marinisporobacter balticus TaxID=2018667 RepID=A0A4R2KY68_9FIRM|nr:hypothetical protein [Marinisporobacter balticus]TCO78042.1 hypothetical protein EV214_105141 [Marinisporobacter balticus]